MMQKEDDNANTSVKDTLPPDEEVINKFKQRLHNCVEKDIWDHELDGYDKYPGIAILPLTENKNTALHVAAMKNSTTFLKMFVNSNLMSHKDMETRNADNNTAFCMAAISGHSGSCLKYMIKRNMSLPLIAGQNGMLPIHLAALNGHHETVQEMLSSKEMDLLDKMALKDIERLFLIVISNVMYDVAKVLFAKYPDLAHARDDEWVKTLHMQPAPKPLRKFYKSTERLRMDDELEFLKTVWSHVKRSDLKHKDISELTHLTSPALFDAVRSGKVDAVKWFLSTDPDELLLLKDPFGRNLLHIAVKHRQQSIMKFILDQVNTEDLINRIIYAEDNDGNNILHFAALYVEPEETSSRLNTRMERELAWFKEVQGSVSAEGLKARLNKKDNTAKDTSFRLEVRNCVPAEELKARKNKKGYTPKDTFLTNHNKLANEDKDAAKGIANSGMLVAALIATIAFAAAVTLTGEKSRAWFVVFILTNALALFTSSASIISFLSVFTSSWFTENEFIVSLYLIKLGLWLLIISVVAMVISFIAASFLIFDHIFPWVAYVVTFLGFLPVLWVFVLQTQLVNGLVRCFIGLTID